MNQIIINMTKASEGSESLEVGDLKPKDATDKPGIKVKLDESTSDVPAKPEDVSKDEEKTAEALSAEEKAPIKVKAEASPKTEDALNNTDSAAAAEDMADDVAKETDDYVTEGSTAKADDSSSAITTKRESQAPMNKKEAARKTILTKLAVHMLRKQAEDNLPGKPVGEIKAPKGKPGTVRGIADLVGMPMPTPKKLPASKSEINLPGNPTPGQTLSNFLRTKQDGPLASASRSLTGSAKLERPTTSRSRIADFLVPDAFGTAATLGSDVARLATAAGKASVKPTAGDAWAAEQMDKSNAAKRVLIKLALATCNKAKKVKRGKTNLHE